MAIKIEIVGPLVDVIVTEALATSDLPDLLAAITSARRRGPFVLITDTLKMKSAPLPIISAFSDGLKKLPPMKDVWLADAVLINSGFARFALSTLAMLAPLPTEVKVFEHRAAGEQWCTAILEKAGVSLPAHWKSSNRASQ